MIIAYLVTKSRQIRPPGGDSLPGRRVLFFYLFSLLFFKYSLALELLTVYNSFKLLDRSFPPVDNLLISPLFTVEKGLWLVDNLKPYFFL